MKIELAEDTEWTQNKDGSYQIPCEIDAEFGVMLQKYRKDDEDIEDALSRFVTEALTEGIEKMEKMTPKQRQDYFKTQEIK